MDFTPLWLSLKLSLITSLVLLIICFPFAALLAFRNFRGKTFLESMVTLPLVLPPTVIGFYLLVLFSPYFAFGKFLKDVFNVQLVFSFPGLVIASCLHSFPFMTEPLKTGMVRMDKSLIEASYTLGKSRIQTFFSVILPVIRPSVLSGMVLTFAHTLGEFGVVLMIGGNMPGSTRVISVAIYEKVETLNFHDANIYSIILVLISLAVLMTVHYANRAMTKEKGL